MTAPARARAAQAIELQAAREAAGLTVEEVAGRIVDMWDARQGNGRRKSWQSMVDKLTGHLAYLERASQGAYDRADEWAQLPVAERTSPRPRVRCELLREALAVIRTDSPSRALAEFVLANALAQADNFRASGERAQDAARERGGDLATLVWNAAEDPDFLDRALVDELAAVPPRHLAYLVRAALVDLADELRVTFPDRPSRDLRAVA